MKATIFLLALVTAMIGFRFVASTALSDVTDSLELRNLDRYNRITEQPFQMDDWTAELCRDIDKTTLGPHMPVHFKSAFCNVYVNDVAKKPMISGVGIYPEGSIIIKSKLATIDDKEPELYTVMQKMKDGYDAEHGNWKYFVVDGSSLRQLAVGRIDSCIECHLHYKKTDHVTREYLKEKQRTS